MLFPQSKSEKSPVAKYALYRRNSCVGFTEPKIIHLESFRSDFRKLLLKLIAEDLWPESSPDCLNLTGYRMHLKAPNV